MNPLVDFQGTPLTIGDTVAFSSLGGMLDKAIIVESEIIGKFSLVVLVATRADGSHTTHKIHPAHIAKIQIK